MKTPTIEMPRFANDLYRDLRDRRLLIPLVALLAALVLVPVLLSRGATETVPPAVVAPPAGATEAQAAVLVEEPIGVRNYRQRLDALKEKNPFKPLFEPKAASAGGSGDASVAVGGSDASIAVADEAGSAVSVTAPTGSTSAGVDVAATSEPVPTGSADGSATVTVPGDAQPAANAEKPEPRFYAARIDVRFGKLGETKVIEGVRSFDFLPDEKFALVSYLGVREDATAAVFAVSTNVADTSGDGSCAPTNSEGCQFLTLRAGEERQLAGIDGETYRLKLVAIDVVAVPDPRED